MLRGKVVDISSDGWGVVKNNNSGAVFLPGTWIGDEVEYEILSTGKFTLGRVVNWISKVSAHRPSPCQHWGLEENSCLACPWMGISYTEQLKVKEEHLKKTLRFFKIAPQTITPIVYGSEFAYRNRVKLSTQADKVGFKRPLSKQFVAISKCIVCEGWINDEISKLSTETLSSNEIWIQKAKGDSFAQGNSYINKKMKSFVQEVLSESKFQNTMELFCGDGNFSDLLLQVSKHLFAYEASEEAINNLRMRFPQVQAQKINLYSKNSINILSGNTHAELLFLDPPRTGFKDLSLLVNKLPHLKKIIYVSCNQMTWGRDVSALKDWKLTQLQAFDLFPQTPHLELISVFDRNVAPL